MVSRHLPRSQKDPVSLIPSIQDPRSWGILDLILSFSLHILEILDPVTETLLWDHRDLDLGQKRFCRILGILDPAWAGYRGILQILDLTQQYVTVS